MKKWYDKGEYKPQNVDDIIKDLKDKDEAEDFVYHFKKSFEPKKESYAKYVL